MITNKNLFWNITLIVENLNAIKMQLPRDEPKDSEEYATRGPFTNIFDGAIARLLDQAIIVGNMEQTITILAESINQSYKTTKAHLRNLEKWALSRRQEK